MYRAHVISVNPGVKTLGEMHNPSRMTCLSSQEIGHGKGESERHDDRNILFSRRDMNRPALPLLLVRLVMAGVCGWIMTLTGDDVSFWLLAASAAMIVPGLLTRLAVVLAVVTSVYTLFGAVDTAQMPHVMTAIAIVVPLAGFLYVTGAGRWSIDRLLRRREN